MRDAIKHFEKLSREEILAQRPGTWSDVRPHFPARSYGYLDVQHLGPAPSLRWLSCADHRGVGPGPEADTPRRSGGPLRPTAPDDRSPEQREQILEFLRYLLNRPEAHERPEEETFIGFLIADILDMAEGRSLYPDIRQALERSES